MFSPGMSRLGGKGADGVDFHTAVLAS